MKKIYTYEYCKEHIKEFVSLKELKEKNYSMLVVIRRNGWFDLLDGLKRLVRQKYTKEECIDRISQYVYFSDFFRENESMCVVIRRNKWHDILKPLKRRGSKYKRCIYVYEFNVKNEKYAYIGLTFNLETRDFTHRNDKKSAVYKFSKITNVEIPAPIQLTDYIDRQEASKLEGEYVKLYNERGWNILNVAKTGGLGGKEYGFEYNKENCLQLAKEYTSRAKFAKERIWAFNLIRLNGWEEEAFAHMIKFDRKRDSTANKKVVQYSISGEKLNEYRSIKEASRQTKIANSCISRCCHGERKIAGGYIWRFYSQME